jgi:hypothetical protein
MLVISRLSASVISLEICRHNFTAPVTYQDQGLCINGGLKLGDF